MRIQNNQPAFNTWTNYTVNLSGMQKSMNRLSTGIKSLASTDSGTTTEQTQQTDLQSKIKSITGLDLLA